MNAVTIDTVKTIFGYVYIAKFEIGSSDYYIVGHSKEQLQTQVTKYVTLVKFYDGETYGSLSVWQFYNTEYDTINADSIDDICDHYIEELNDIATSYNNAVSDANSDLVDDYIYAFYENLHYIDGLQTTIANISANNDIELSNGDIQYIVENIEKFVEIEIFSNLYVGANCVSSLVFGEIEIDLHDVVPPHIAELIANRTDIFVSVNSDRVYGYLNYSYNGIFAKLDIDAVVSLTNID